MYTRMKYEIFNPTRDVPLDFVASFGIHAWVVQGSRRDSSQPRITNRTERSTYVEEPCSRFTVILVQRTKIKRLVDIVISFAGMLTKDLSKELWLPRDIY